MIGLGVIFDGEREDEFENFITGKTWRWETLQ